MTTITLTKKEQDLLYEIVNSQIQWEGGGCLTKDDDTNELDKRKLSLAKKILEKI